MGVRVLVVGRGFGARVVAPSYASAGATVVDVVAPREVDSMRRACARPDIDLVSVHAPPFLHGVATHAAVTAGHAVVCDKPFGLDVDDTTAMLAHAEAASVVHVANFEFRFHPGRQMLRRLVRAGAVGAVEHVSWVHDTSGSRVPLRPHGWLFDSSSGGGWIGAWGAHVVDAVQWIFGDVQAVAGRRRQVIEERPGLDGVLVRGDAEDGFSAALVLAGGATVTIDSTFAATRSLPSRITVLGSDGVIDVVADQDITVRRADGTKEAIVVTSPEGDPHLGPMATMADRIVRAVRGDEPADPDLATLTDARASASVMDELRSLPLAPVSGRRSRAPVSGRRNTWPEGDGR